MYKIVAFDAKSCKLTCVTYEPKSYHNVQTVDTGVFRYLGSKSETKPLRMEYCHNVQARVSALRVLFIHSASTTVS